MAHGTRSGINSQRPKSAAVLIVAGQSQHSYGQSWRAFAPQTKLRKREKLIPERVHAPLWVTEFPMFEYHEDDDRYYAMHHPFTSPVDDDLPLLERAVQNDEQKLLGQVRAKLTTRNRRHRSRGRINSNSSSRHSEPRLQSVGDERSSSPRALWIFLDALSYGTPPHGGIASALSV